jgi:hypothetical protein
VSRTQDSEPEFMMPEQDENFIDSFEEEEEVTQMPNLSLMENQRSA